MADENKIISEIFAQHGVKSNKELEALNSRLLKHVDLDGVTYQVKLLGGRKGIPVALRLKKIALPLIGRALDGLKDEDDFIETPKTFTDMAVLLNHSLEESHIESLIFDDILFDVKVKVDGEFKDIDWDEYLIGNYSCLIPLLAFAIKENFSSFFTGSGMTKNILSKIGSLLVSSQDKPQDEMTKEQTS